MNTPVYQSPGISDEYLELPTSLGPAVVKVSSIILLKPQGEGSVITSQIGQSIGLDVP